MASGTVYQRPTSGRSRAWVAHATWNEGGRRRQTKRTFKTKREAQDALVGLLASRRSGTFVEPTRLTLRSYLAQWLSGLVNIGRAPTTLRNYRGKVDLYVLPRIGDMPLQELRATDLDALYADLLTQGGTRGDGRLSLATVHQVHVILGKALHDAERKGLVTGSVARLASPPTLTAARSRAPEMKVWTPTQLRGFLSSLEGGPWEAVLHVLAMTGMRRSEVVALRWSDIDFDRNRLTIHQAATFVNGEEVVGPPKSRRSRRIIDLDAVTVAVLRRHRTAQLEERMFIGAGAPHENGRVFGLADGRSMRGDSITRAFGRLISRSGLPPIRLHDLRHTHATHLLAAGVNVKLVSERLGHASVSFTLDTYGHCLPGQQAEAAAAVSSLVFEPS